ncbi:hypothetical protein AM588_10002015 [Phytophthora nicotianae]|uniref:Uncharacterized protein n=1 Tax=Phytophthora nicotianae TaxID=4792 RepID=A0A0W8CY94_PHYNI|nr:hypothetical protein AM588_10002015 [Phytophthora nicotianae]
MDLALTTLDALRQIFELRDAIRRQRHENRKTYLRMMEIYVELQLSPPLQENPTLQRAKAVQRFVTAVDSFSKYLQKYYDMHRVVRMFKHVKMEEKRQKIASEIDELFRMLNLAATVTMMNEQATASSNAAKLFAKLENMHGDIRLSHDQIHAALLADRQQLELVKKKKVVNERGPTVEKFAAIEVGEVRQPSFVETDTPAVTDEKPALKYIEENPTAETKLDDELEEKALTDEATLMQVMAEVGGSDMDENADTEIEEKVLNSASSQSTANVVIGANVLAVPKVELAELKQTSAGDDAEDKTPTGEEPALMENVVDQVDKEKEAAPQSPLSSSTPIDESSVPRLIQLLGSDQTTEQQKERALLHLMSMCVTSSNRVQVYKTKGIPVLTDLVHNSDNFFTQLYALHCLSWFTFSYSKMSESAFMKLQECAREPTHSEILSILHELQYGDDKTKEVAALQCSCLATRGDGDTLRRVGVLPLLVRLLSGGAANQQLWASEALVTLASDSDETCVAITREGAIPPLVELLRSGSDMHKQEAAYALGNLAANNPVNRAKIAREGAIPPLVAFVKAATDDQNQWAIYALGFLSLSNEENRVLIAQEGAIPALVELLRTGTRAQKQWSAYTLGNLAHNDNNRVEITLEGAITPLIELLRVGTEMQKQRAAFALGNLACDNNVATDLDEAILPLVELARTGSDTQKEDAAYTLGNLAANNVDRRVEIGRKGAIPPLVQLLRTGNDDQKQWAVFALRCLAYDNDTNREAIVEEGAIEALAELMEKGTEEQKEQATHAHKHLVLKKEVAANSDRFTSPLVGYLRARINSENANVAAALNTLEIMREGFVPLFHRLVKVTDAPIQPVSIHQKEHEFDPANAKADIKARIMAEA